MIQRLLNQAKYMEELRTELFRNSRPVSEAILGNHVVAVECLLHGAGLEMDLLGLNSQGESLLDIALAHSSPTILRLLAPWLLNVTQQADGRVETALTRMIESKLDSKGCRRAASILLSYIHDESTAYITTEH